MYVAAIKPGTRPFHPLVLDSPNCQVSQRRCPHGPQPPPPTSLKSNSLSDPITIYIYQNPRTLGPTRPLFQPSLLPAPEPQLHDVNGSTYIPTKLMAGQLARDEALSGVSTTVPQHHGKGVTWIAPAR